MCKQLGQIHAALTRATGVSFEEDGSGAAAEPVSSRVAPGEFLHALQELQKKECLDVAPGRNLIRSLIEQMEGQVLPGSNVSMPRSFKDILRGRLKRKSRF